MKARFEFGTPKSGHPQERVVRTKQGSEIIYTLPSFELPLLLNGDVIGYVEVHMHAAWAPDGVPDVSFGFTGRVNSRELEVALRQSREVK